MTVPAPSRPARDLPRRGQVRVRRPPDPVLRRGVLVQHLARRRAHTTPTSSIWSPTSNGMHPVLALRPERDGAPVPTRSARLPDGSGAGGPRTAASSSAVFEAPTHPAAARRRARPCAWSRRPATLTPFTGTYLFRDPADGAAGLHLLRDRPALPGHRARGDAVRPVDVREPGQRRALGRPRRRRRTRGRPWSSRSTTQRTARATPRSTRW